MEADLDAAFAKREAAGRSEGIEVGRSEGIEVGRSEGLAAGIARERELLRSMAALKFGAEAAAGIAARLEVCGPEALKAAGGCLIECDTGAEAVERIGAIAELGGNGGFHS